jgi:hypothetical protein
MELLGELTTQVRGWMENFQEKRNERPPDEYFMCLSPLYLLLGVVERFWMLNKFVNRIDNISWLRDIGCCSLVV